MTSPAPQERRSVVAAIAGPVIVAVVIAVIAWIALLLVKGVVVVLTYALGVALIVVPLFLGSRVIEGSAGKERWRRIGALALTVLVGVLLCWAGHEIHRHGWLIIAIPAAAVLVSRLMRRFGRRGRGPRPSGGTITIEMR